MRYTVKELAVLSGVSTRTLRYYDEVGLLKPARIRENGYREYGQEQVDTLQQILFYRQLDVGLEEIGKILHSPDFDPQAALEGHLEELLVRKESLEKLIGNVKRTLSASKGEIIMENKEKFEGFKKKLVEDNEKQYGKEVRQRYGNESVDASNARLGNMTEEEWEDTQALSGKLNETLKRAVEAGDPEGELAMEACRLHREWLCRYWPEGMYTPEAHLGLAEMYVADERFKAYYDKIAEGAAEFLRSAVANFIKEN